MLIGIILLIPVSNRLVGKVFSHLLEKTTEWSKVEDQIIDSRRVIEVRRYLHRDDRRKSNAGSCGNAAAGFKGDILDENSMFLASVDDSRSSRGVRGEHSI